MISEKRVNGANQTCVWMWMVLLDDAIGWCYIVSSRVSRVKLRVVLFYLCVGCGPIVRSVNISESDQTNTAERMY